MLVALGIGLLASLARLGLSHWRRCRPRVSAAWKRAIISAAVVLGCVAPVEAQVQYIYDELGRLSAVIAQNGDRADYEYDAAGNITAVRRVSSGTLDISEITPNIGSAGTAVRIIGSGFSATAAANTVRFNGTVATVSAATPSQLTVVAPSGGTSGPVSVSVGANTATSQDAFTYVGGAVAAAPTIASFAPNNGVAGNQITITGTNFDPAPNGTVVEFNGDLVGQIVSISTTQIVVSIPQDATSGRLRVITALGTATSSADLVVPPAGYTFADIVARQRLALGSTTASLNITAANKHGMLLFDGAQGQSVTIYVRAISTVPAGQVVNYKVYGPGNVLIASGATTGVRSLHLPPLPRAGTYAAVFTPPGSSANLTLSVSQDPVVVVGGTATSIAAPVNDVSVRAIFVGQAGQKLGLGLKQLTTTNNIDVQIIVDSPDGSVLNSVYCSAAAPEGGCELDVFGSVIEGLRQSGLHSIRLMPSGSGSGRITGGTLTMSADVVTTLSPGTPRSVTLARAGQNGRLTFAGIAGQSVTLRYSAVSSSPANQVMRVQEVMRADGSGLWNTAANPTTLSDGEVVYIASLPATETYTVFVDPEFAATGSMTVTLNPPMDVSIDGASAPISTAGPGRERRLMFSGVAGQKVGLGLTGLTTSDSREVQIVVNGPDRGSVASGGCHPTHAGCELNLSNEIIGLPLTGTYTVRIIPASAASQITGGALLLSSDHSSVLVPNVPSAVNLTRAGQNGRLTFAGTAGQSVTLRYSGVTTNPANLQMRVHDVYRANGNRVSGSANATTNGDGEVAYIASLPATETYTVFVDPEFAATGSMTVTLNPPMDVSMDGASVPIATSGPGRERRLMFSGVAGQKVGLGLIGLTTSDNREVQIAVNGPDRGSVAFAPGCHPSQSGCELNLGNAVVGLPWTGTYTVRIIPNNAASQITGGTLQLSSDHSSVLVPNVPSAVTLTRAGQNGRLTFAGTAGQSVTLRYSGVTTNPANLQMRVHDVYRADGNRVSGGANATTNSDGEVTYIASLPATETYTVFVDPEFAATGSMTVTLNPPMDVSMDGASVPIATSGPGRERRLMFSGVAGQKVGLGLIGLATSDNREVQITVNGPDRGLVAYAPGCHPSQSGCELNLGNAVVGLPWTGTYTVRIIPNNPSSQLTGGALLLSSDATASLAIGTPHSATLTRNGQNGSYTFSGSTGQTLRLTVTTMLTTPIGEAVSFHLHDPAGSSVATPTFSGPGSYDIPALGSTGQYTLFVSPQFGATLTSTFVLVPR
jgi:YD repeat-containing protein